jgi:hypothetical protein
MLEDDLDDYCVSRMRREHKQKSSKSNRTFNQTTSTEIVADFNTPLNENKRSRSLTSVRRRHWSATSNRSSSVTSNNQQHYRQKSSSRSTVTNNNNNKNLNSIKNINVRSKFVNVENRDQRQIINSNGICKSSTRNYLNKSNSSNAVYLYEKNEKNFEHYEQEDADFIERGALFNQSIKSGRIKTSKLSTSKSTIMHSVKLNKQQSNLDTTSAKKLMNTSSVSIGKYLFFLQAFFLF